MPLGLRLIVVLIGHSKGIAKNMVGIADVSKFFDRDRRGSGVAEPVRRRDAPNASLVCFRVRFASAPFSNTVPTLKPTVHRCRELKCVGERV